MLLRVNLILSNYLTGLNPFTLLYCGPSPPCVRFTDGVTDTSATLGTRCLARAYGARTFT